MNLRRRFLSFRGVMPRLYELKDRADLADPNAYFRRNVWAAWLPYCE